MVLGEITGCAFILCLSFRRYFPAVGGEMFKCRFLVSSELQERSSRTSCFRNLRDN